MVSGLNLGVSVIVIVRVRVVLRKTVVGHQQPTTNNNNNQQPTNQPTNQNSLSQDYPHPDDHAKHIPNCKVKRWEQSLDPILD